MLAAPLQGRLTGLILPQGAADSTRDLTRVGRTPVQPACRKRACAERVPDPQGLESPPAARKRACTERAAAEPRGLEDPPTASKKRARADASGDSPDGLSSPMTGGKGRPRPGQRVRRGGPKATGGRLWKVFFGVSIAVSNMGEAYATNYFRVHHVVGGSEYGLLCLAPQTGLKVINPSSQHPKSHCKGAVLAARPSSEIEKCNGSGLLDLLQLYLHLWNI